MISNSGEINIYDFVSYNVGIKETVILKIYKITHESIALVPYEHRPVRHCPSLSEADYAEPHRLPGSHCV